MEDLFAANIKCFSQIIKGNKTFIVPNYQRSYTWGENQWNQLWHTISKFTEDNHKHFLGSIIVTSINDDNYHLIDGQQRLTTISIVILCIIEKLNKLIDYGIDIEKNKDYVNLILHDYLILKGDLDSSTKIVLNEINHPFYSENLIPFKAPAQISKLHKSNRALYNCYNYFSQKIDIECQWLNNWICLTELLKSLESNLTFLEIITNNTTHSYTIMETLNDHGMSPALTDSLKNYLFDFIKPSDKKNIKTKWNEIIKVISFDNFPAYLKHFLQSYNRFNFDKNLLELIQEKVQTRKELLDLIDELYDIAPFYGALIGTNASFVHEDDTIMQLIDEMRLFGVTEFMPLLISVYRKPDLGLLKEILKMCSIISFRYSIIGSMNSYKLEPIINETALMISNNKLITSKDIFNKIKHLHIDKEQFKNSFKRRSVNSNLSKELVRYILFNIENKISNTSYNYLANEAVIEHILPVNPSNHWKVNFPKDQLDEYIYRLGNLTLLEDNFHKDGIKLYFKEKKCLYEKSCYQLSSKFHVNNWDPATLENRQLQLAKIAEDLWKYHP